MRLVYLISLTVSALCNSACAKQTYDLGNGLTAVDLSSRNYMIIKDDIEIVVYPKILMFCKRGDNVIGFRVDPEGDNSDGGPEFTENLGYFDLDTRSKKVHYRRDLSIEDLREKCGNSIFP